MRLAVAGARAVADRLLDRLGGAAPEPVVVLQVGGSRSAGGEVPWQAAQLSPNAALPVASASRSRAGSARIFATEALASCACHVRRAHANRLDLVQNGLALRVAEIHRTYNRSRAARRE